MGRRVGWREREREREEESGRRQLGEDQRSSCRAGKGCLLCEGHGLAFRWTWQSPILGCRLARPPALLPVIIIVPLGREERRALACLESI